MAGGGITLPPVQRIGLEKARVYADYCRHLYLKGGLLILEAELQGLVEYEQENGTAVDDWLENEEKHTWLTRVIDWLRGTNSQPSSLANIWSEDLISQLRKRDYIILEAEDPIPFDIDSDVEVDDRDDPATWLVEEEAEWQDTEDGGQEDGEQMEVDGEMEAEDETGAEEAQQAYAGSQGIDPVLLYNNLSQLAAEQAANSLGHDAATHGGFAAEDYDDGYEADFGGGCDEDSGGGFDREGGGFDDGFILSVDGTNEAPAAEPAALTPGQPPYSSLDTDLRNPPADPGMPDAIPPALRGLANLEFDFQDDPNPAAASPFSGLPPPPEGVTAADIASPDDLRLPTPPLRATASPDMEYHFAPLPLPAPAAAPPEIERPVDLGIGPSELRQGSLPLQPDRVTAGTAAKQASAPQRKRRLAQSTPLAPTVPKRRKQQQSGKERNRTFKRSTIDWQDVDLKYLRLPGNSSNPPGRGKKRVKIVRNRSSYQQRKQPPPRPVDPCSEENLLKHFHLEPKKRASFTLSNYRLFVAGTEQHANLLALAMPAQASHNLVLVGEATPSDLVGSIDSHRVRLNVKLDRLKLPFHAAGPVLSSRLGSYRLSGPAPDYEHSTRDYRRLLNVFTYARSCRLRGGFVAEPGEILELGEKVRELLKALQAGKVSLKWQHSLPEEWCMPVSELSLTNDRETQLLFHTLADIPFFSPFVAQRTVLHLPPHCFRTSNFAKVKRRAEEERDNTELLLQEYRQKLIQDETDSETDDGTFQRPPPKVEAVEPVKGSARLLEDLRRKVGVLQKVRIDGQIFSAGDVVLVRNEKRLSRSRVRVAEEDDSTEDELDWEDDDSEDEDEHDGNEPEQNPEGLWFAQVVYFFHDPAAKVKLRAHIVSFAHPSTIPSLGPYISPRHLFQLDDCQNIRCTAIIAKVPDFSFLKPDEPAPSRGFYSRFLYSKIDGSFTDAPILAATPSPTCAQKGLQPCTSCESTLIFDERTNDEGVYIPVRSEKSGVLFTLAGIEYHENDFILVHPCVEEGSRHGSKLPLRLARLLEICPPNLEENDDHSQSLSKVRVEWYVRAVECGIYATKGRKQDDFKRDEFSSERELILTGQEHDILTTRIDGRFTLVHFDPVKEEESGNAFEAVHKLESAAQPTLFWCRRRREDVTDTDVVCLEDGLFDLNDKQCKPVSARSLEFNSCSTCVRAEREKQQTKDQVEDAINTAKAAGKSVFDWEATALYAGGGFLDMGLGQGCSTVKTRRAVEHHRPAAEFMLHNNRETERIDIETVSDHVERAYHEYATANPPIRPLFLSGGSPCQGFSSVNRYKREDDLRCLEPFVFLSALSVHRSLAGLFEDVAAFREHALPIKGAKRGSFFHLFVAVLLEMGYQVRWNIDDAAAHGVPQNRRRLIIPFAMAGFPLPAAPALSHVVPNGTGRRQFNHELLEENTPPFSRQPGFDAAPHAPVTFADITFDLPEFTFELCFTKDGYQQQEVGFSWGDQQDDDGEDKPFGEYRTPPLGTYARRLRFRVVGGVTAHAELSYHVCASVRQETAERIVGIGFVGEGQQHGDYRDLDPSSPSFPTIPEWLRRKVQKLAFWWARLKLDELLAPLRTKLNIDGSSHGPRLHPLQKRFISVREMIRAMGAPDSVEYKFDDDAPDDSCEEIFRIVGNAVPVPLAEAYGRAFHEATLPLLLEAIDSGQEVENVFETAWRKINPDHEARQEKATVEAAKAFLEREARLRGTREGRFIVAEKAEEEGDDEEEGGRTEANSARASSPELFAPVARPSNQRLTRTTSGATSSSSTSASPDAFSPSAPLSRAVLRGSTRPTSVESATAGAGGTSGDRKGKGKSKAATTEKATKKKVEVLVVDDSSDEEEQAKEVSRMLVGRKSGSPVKAGKAMELRKDADGFLILDDSDSE